MQYANGSKTIPMTYGNISGSGIYVTQHLTFARADRQQDLVELETILTNLIQPSNVQ